MPGGERAHRGVQIIGHHGFDRVDIFEILPAEIIGVLADLPGEEKYQIPNLLLQ